MILLVLVVKSCSIGPSPALKKLVPLSGTQEMSIHALTKMKGCKQDVKT